MSSNSTGKANQRRKWINRVILAVVGVAVIAAVVVAWLPKPIPVDIEQASETPMTVTINEDGKTRVKDRYIVSAPLSGNLARIELEAGDRVKAGDVIARILPMAAPLLDTRSRAQASAQLAAAEAMLRQARASEKRADAALAFAQKERERMTELVKQKAVSKASVEQAIMAHETALADKASAQFGVRVAKHQAELAQAALGRIRDKRDDEHLEITAPVNGVVLEILRPSEGVVQSGMPVLEIGDDSAMEIVVDVLSRDAVQIRPGTRATIERWGGGTALPAKVARVEPKAFTTRSSLGVEEQRVNVILDFEAPHEKWSSLGDGYRVEAKIVTWETDKALNVPIGSIFRKDGKWAVYTVQGEEAALTHIEIGKRSSTQAQVLSGLSAGQKIIVHPGERVTNGASVTGR